MNPPRLSVCTNTHARAEKQITQIAARLDDFSQTNAQKLQHLRAGKRKTPNTSLPLFHISCSCLSLIRCKTRRRRIKEDGAATIFAFITAYRLLITGKYSGKARPHQSIPRPHLVSRNAPPCLHARVRQRHNLVRRGSVAAKDSSNFQIASG